MAFLRDPAKDAALADLNNVVAMHVCSQEPTTYTEAVTTYSIGNKTPVTIGAAGDGTPDGRKRTVAAFTNGTQTAAGIATHWALVSGSALIATGELVGTPEFTGVNFWASAEFDVTIGDAEDA